MKENKIPVFFVYFKPILEILKEIGGTGSAQEIKDLVIKRLKISENELEETLKNGIGKIDNLITWASNYLDKSGYIDKSKKGFWTITEKTLNAKLTDEELLQSYRNILKTFFQPSEKVEIITDNEQLIENSLYNYTIHRDKLLEILKKISPKGFENICQRLLRTIGFKKVEITGKSGDGGIDGIGLIEINPVLSIKVLFQCKRYEGTISSPQIRDFRGAMNQRADKGLFITTGRFTQDAKNEAERVSDYQIECIDGNRLIELFEEYEIGLKPKKVYEIDEEFFNDFK